MIGVEEYDDENDMITFYERVDLENQDLKGNRNFSLNDKSLFPSVENFEEPKKILTPETLFTFKVFNFAYGEREPAFFRCKTVVSPPFFSEESILEARKFQRVDDEDTVLELVEYIELEDEEFEDFDHEGEEEDFPRLLSEFNMEEDF